MYRYSISQEEARACTEHYLNFQFRKAHVFSNVILGLFILILWFVILLLLQYVEVHYGESGWVRTWPFPGDMVDFFYTFSALCVISCFIQRKKFDKLKWSYIVKTEKYRKRLALSLEKMEKGKDWKNPDWMEYDEEKREIRLLNKKPRAYSIPPRWEDFLTKVRDDLFYGFVTDQSGKPIIVPWKRQNTN